MEISVIFFWNICDHSRSENHMQKSIKRAMRQILSITKNANSKYKNLKKLAHTTSKIHKNNDQIKQTSLIQQLHKIFKIA